MGDGEEPNKGTRRRSRTVSWDHSVRYDGNEDDGTQSGRRSLADRGFLQLPSQGSSTSPSLRDSSITEFFADDNMSISRGHSVEKVRFSASRAHSDENDEDYSASVNAILHKRLSVRKGKHQKQRRSSSPVSSMLPDDASLLSDRRRSSAFTTSSGDTAINIEEAGISQEQIFENIRLHKEVLGSVRQQPWSIRRKMKLVQQAKEYVKKHEGQLQERLAMSKSTRDILARFHILVVKQWQHSKREMANFISQIIPWELTIKEIESQFGTVVASYFTFLRWLFWVNFVISVLLAAFVVIPEVLTGNKTESGERKTLLPEEEATSMEFMTLLNFEGVLQHSAVFYGYYSNRQSSDTGYRLPTAYFITGLVVYIYSFVATLRKMAANSRLSKLSEKDDECVFTWKLFTGWDYMIGNEETAHNRISSIILGFKEALLEEAERMKDKQNWKTISLRVFANLNMLWMLGSSVYAVILVVERSTEKEAELTTWRKYEITVVMTLIGTFFPIAFEILALLESYHPRTTLRVQLARIMALNLLNLYTLTFALFVKINDMTKELLSLKPDFSNATSTAALPNGTDRTTFSTAASLVMSMALLNSSMPTTTTVPHHISHFPVPWPTSTTTTTYSPVVRTIEIPPNCERRFTECPVPSPITVPPFGPNVVRTVNVSRPTEQTERTERTDRTSTALSRATVATDSATDDRPSATTTVADTAFGGGDDGSTLGPTDETWTDGTTGRTAGPEDDDYTESVQSLLISGVTVGSTESSGAGSSFDPSDYGSAELGSTEYGPTDDDRSTTDFTDRRGTTEFGFTDRGTTEFGSVDRGTTDFGSVDRGTTKFGSVDRATEEFDTVDRRTTDYSATDDGPITDDTETTTTSVNAEKFTESQLSSKNGGNDEDGFRRRKRSPELILSEKGCYMVVCQTPSPPPPPSFTVTEVPNGSPGFTTRSSEAYGTTTEHEDAPREDLSLHATCLSLETRRRLRKLCWETMFGQELVKLTVMDLLSTIISTIFVDFARAVFVRYMNRCWCWNLEKRFPQYGDFKIAENILHLVNNQGMVWMGMFFSPGLPIINVVKLMIMMYVRSWAVLTCNVPHDVVFRASRSNNFYLGLLLTMLFLCVLPVGYAIVWIEPSWHCGPFSQYKKIYHIFTNSIKKAVPNPKVHQVLDYIASPGIIIPLLLLLILIIYYLASLTSSLREANNDLKTQLRRERTEERRKMFELVNRKKEGDDDDDDYTCLDSTLAKWRQIMPDCKLPADGPAPISAFGLVQRKNTENDVLDRVREKLVHMETDDQQPTDSKESGAGTQQAPQQPIHQYHHHHHQQHFHHHHHRGRRPSRSEEPRDPAAALRKWKKTKAFVARRQSTESESSDQSEAVPEIRVVKSTSGGGSVDSVAVAAAAATDSTNGNTLKVSAASMMVAGGFGQGKISGGVETVGGGNGGGGGSGSGGGVGDGDGVVEQPVKQRARLKLAQILYKEARRRRQKYVEELQNQQE